jgi:hypothetical protein
MKTSSILLVGLIVSVLASAAIAPQAMAGVHYRRGMGIGVDNDQALSFQRPGDYHATLTVGVWPLWYYVEGLDTYDTVTMDLTLHTYKMISHGSLPILFGDNCVSLQGGGLQCTWRNVHLSQDEDGVTLDATLHLGIDIVVGSDAGIGLYSLTFDGIATAPGVIFEGHTFVTLLVYS